MNSSRFKYPWFTSFGIVLLLFILVNFVFFPLFNSGDDVFLLYNLSGGFGDSPTHLLHYDHIWHPVLGRPVAWLYSNYPSLNWYTLILLSFQIAGCTATLYVLFRRFHAVPALGIFLLLFCFVESRALLSLTFTYSAWIIAAGGFCLLLDESINDVKRKWINLVFAGILLLLAGLLRLQVLLAVTVLFLPVFLLNARFKFRIWVPVMLGVWVIVYFSNLQQKQYYKSHIPGWAKEEKMRQSLFYAFNRPNNWKRPFQEIFRDSTEAAFYGSQFFFDTSFFSPKRVGEISKALTRVRNFREKDDWQALYWLFIEWRVYILLIAICFFILWQRGVLSKVLRRWWLPAFIVLGFYFYLFLFLKITEPVHLGVLWLLGLFVALAMPQEIPGSFALGKRFRYSLLFFLLPLTWITVRLVKKDRENKERHQRFECVTRELKQHTDKLFVSTDDGLPMDYFYIWDKPVNNKIGNIIYKDRVLTRSYGGTLERFGIKDLITAIPEDSSVFLLGKDFPALVNYYREKHNLPVTLSSRLANYNCLEVRKLSVTSAAGRINSQ